MEHFEVTLLNATNGEESNVSTSTLPVGFYTMCGYGSPIPFIKGPYGYNEELAEDLAWANEGSTDEEPVIVDVLCVGEGSMAIIPRTMVTIPVDTSPGFGEVLVMEERRAVVIAALRAAEESTGSVAVSHLWCAVNGMARLLGVVYDTDERIMKASIDPFGENDPPADSFGYDLTELMPYRAAGGRSSTTA